MNTRLKIASVFGLIVWCVGVNLLVWWSPGPEVTLTGWPARIYLITAVCFFVGSIYFAYWVIKEEFNRKKEQENEDRI
jgi:hypothetical protein